MPQLAQFTLALERPILAHGLDSVGQDGQDGGMENEFYTAARWIVGVVTGLIVWVVAIAEYGLFGLLFGWLPAILFGCIAAALTTLILVVILLGLIIGWAVLSWHIFSWTLRLVPG